MKKLILSLCLVLLSYIKIGAQLVFTSCDSVFSYSKSRSIVQKNNALNYQQAKAAKLAAILSIPDVSGGLNFSYTNNTRLPVNLFPAENFGGQPGTYREITTGIQYVSTFNDNLDIKLINLKGWDNVSLAKLNISLSAAEAKTQWKQLRENIAATYFNILKLNEQLKTTRLNLTAADTILSITTSKYLEGVARKQEVNEAEVSKITSEENIRQINYLLKQQYLALKILCDIKAEDSILITQPITIQYEQYSAAVPDRISLQNSQLKVQLANLNYRQLKHSYYPTLSFFHAYNTQQNNNRAVFFDKTAKWIPSSYVGIKLTIPLPGSTLLSQTAKAKFDYRISRNNAEHQELKSVQEAAQINTDYEKYRSQTIADKRVQELSEDSYKRILTLYKEGLVPFQQTINAYNSLVSGRYNYITSCINLLYTQTKININNSEE